LAALFLLGSQIQEDLADDFPPLHAIIHPNLGHCLGDGFIRGNQAQGFQGIHQIGVLIVSRPFLGGRRLWLPLLPGLSTGPHPIENHRLAAQSNSSGPNFTASGLKLKIEHRPFAALM